jgi:hypothetical protein
MPSDLEKSMRKQKSMTFLHIFWNFFSGEDHFFSAVKNSFKTKFFLLKMLHDPEDLDPKLLGNAGFGSGSGSR